MSEYKLTVNEKIVEAKDAVTIKFIIPEDVKAKFINYKAGQFVGLQADVNGEKVVRSYSLSSSPDVDKDFAITLKKVPNGKMSTFLVDRLNVNDQIVVTPPAGHFTPGTLNRHHVLFAAGSGITPIYSMIKTLLQQKAPRVTLIYSNKDEESVIFKQQLKTLEEQNKNFQIKWVFTGQTPDWENVSSGRLTTPILEKLYLLWQSPEDQIFYMCGPEGFMEAIEAFLGQKGYDHSQIRKESFVTSAAFNLEDSDDVIVGKYENSDVGTCETVKAEIDFSDVEVTPEEGETILEALLREGFDPPYSCLEGTCIACQCTVKEGAIKMPDTGMLLQEDYDEGKALSCQARPITKKVKVIYEF